MSYGAAALTHFSLTHIATTLLTHSTAIVLTHSIAILLRLQTIKTIVNSRKFKGSSYDEPRRVQVLDLYCLTRFESEN